MGKLPRIIFTAAEEKYHCRLKGETADGLCRGLRMDTAAPCEPGYLYFPPEAPAEFVNELLFRTERCGAWLDRIDICLEHGAAPQELLDLSGDIFGEPLFIVDPSMKCIAATRGTETTDKFFNEVVSQGYPTLDTYDRLNRGNFYDPHYYSGSVMRLTTNEQPSHEVALKGIRIGGKLAATALMLFQHSDWDDGQVALFSLLTERLAKALETPWSHADRCSEQYDFLLRDLLTGKELSAGEIDARLRFTGCSDPGPCHVVLFTVEDDSKAKLGYICRVSDSVFPGSRPIIYKKYVLTMLPADHGTRDEALDRLENFCAHTNSVCAVSARMETMSELRECFEQTVEMLAIGQALTAFDSWYRLDKQNDRLRIYCHDELAPYCAIRAYAADRHAESLCRSEYLQLLHSDRENNTDDLRILFHYLTGNQNYTEAARRLFMHRNSVFYRVSRIMERIGVTEIDPFMAKGLLFSYMVSDMLSAFSTKDI